MTPNPDFIENAGGKTISNQEIQKSMLDEENMLREIKVSGNKNSSLDVEEDEVKQNNSQLKVTKFLKKYFLEGQKLDGEVQPLVDEDVPFWKRVVSSRRFSGIMIPLTFFEVCNNEY